MSAELQPLTPALPSWAVMNALSETIEQATEPRDLLNLRERAEVLRRLAKRHEAAELQFEATKAKLECERKLGKAIADLIRAHREEQNRASDHPRVGAGRLDGSDKILPEGISWDLSSTWQKLSKLPPPDFEKWLQEHREAGTELTQKSLLDRATVWLRNHGCGSGNDSDDDLDDEDDDDEDDDERNDIDQMIVRTTVAQKREIKAALPALQEFFGTDNLPDTITAMCRQVLRVIEEQE